MVYRVYIVKEVTLDADSWEEAKEKANLEKIDDFNFYHKARAGWFDYDSEYGYFEYNDVTHWMELPEAPPKYDAE